MFKGEIDILEGVNDQSSNFVTLHTAPGTVSHGEACIVINYGNRLQYAPVTCHDWVGCYDTCWKGSVLTPPSTLTQFTHGAGLQCGCEL